MQATPPRRESRLRRAALPRRARRPAGRPRGSSRRARPELASIRRRALRSTAPAALLFRAPGRGRGLAWARRVLRHSAPAVPGPRRRRARSPRPLRRAARLIRVRGRLDRERCVRPRGSRFMAVRSRDWSRSGRPVQPVRPRRLSIRVSRRARHRARHRPSLDVGLLTVLSSSRRPCSPRASGRSRASGGCRSIGRWPRARPGGRPPLSR